MIFLQLSAAALMRRACKLSQEQFDPWTLLNDQGRISPYNIKQPSDDNQENYQWGDYQLV